MRCTVVYCVLFWIFLLSETSEVRRIVGGGDADETKYQYVVRLRAEIIHSDGSKIKKVLEHHHRCTAAVLAPTWTLTSGHCFETKDLEVLLESEKQSFRLVVLHGSFNNLDGSIVLDIIIHPAYKLKLHAVKNDVALMRHNPITLNQYARLSGLDYVTMIGQEVTLVGYGGTNGTLTINMQATYNVAADATSLGKPLQLLDAVIVQCSEDNPTWILKPGMCLARRCNKLSSLCPGDSGGPVLHESGVVGINSVASPQQVYTFCSLEPYSTFYHPGGITPTSPYIDWISSIIRNEVPKHYNQK